LSLKLSGGKDTTTYEGSCVDISISGIGVSSAKPLKHGESVDLWLCHKRCPEEIYAKGKVAWCTGSNLKEWRAGIAFNSLFFLPLHMIKE